jgi:copper(I)-binding protein
MRVLPIRALPITAGLLLAGALATASTAMAQVMAQTAPPIPPQTVSPPPAAMPKPKVEVMPIMVEQAWSRPTLGQSKTGAAYLVLHNHGSETDRLVAVATPVSSRVELHNHVMEGNVMRMVQVGAIEVAPGSPTVLQPGGLHVMLFDVNRRLNAGDTFPMTLTFEKAGQIPIEVGVRSMNPTAPEGNQRPMGAHHHNMPVMPKTH